MKNKTNKQSNADQIVKDLAENVLIRLIKKNIRESGISAVKMQAYFIKSRNYDIGNGLLPKENLSIYERQISIYQESYNEKELLKKR